MNDKEGNSYKDKMCAMMKGCTKKNKNCPWIMIGVGVVLFLIGVFFSAAFIKGLWFIISILVIVMGIFCFMMTSKSEESMPEKEEKEEEKEEEKK